VVGVTALRGRYSESIPTFAACVLIATLPVLPIYLFFQQHLAAGITAGAMKG
jgi:multiple sugar transport system permease protein